MSESKQSAEKEAPLVGQRWRSRDPRDHGKTVVIEAVGRDVVVVRSVRKSTIRLRNFHRLYEPVKSGR